MTIKMALSSLFILLTLYSGLGFADSADIYAVQEQLKSLGYSTGVSDGIYGPSTKAAIVKYQGDNGLDQSGAVDEELLTKLNITDEILADAKTKVDALKKKKKRIALPFDVKAVVENTKVEFKGPNLGTSSNVWVQVRDEDMVGVANGTILSLKIEGQSVPLKSNKLRNNIVSTEIFGDIELRIGPNGLQGAYGTEDQIGKILVWFMSKDPSIKQMK